MLKAGDVFEFRDDAWPRCWEGCQSGEIVAGPDFDGMYPAMLDDYTTTAVYESEVEKVEAVK